MLAVTSELGFFHFVMKVPWPKLFADYNLAAGRLLRRLWRAVTLSPLVCFSQQTPWPRKAEKRPPGVGY